MPSSGTSALKGREYVREQGGYWIRSATSILLFVFALWMAAGFWFAVAGYFGLSIVVMCVHDIIVAIKRLQGVASHD